MSTALSDEELRLGRAAHFDGPDKDLYLDIGFYLTWFACVELAITHALAISTRSSDLEAFDILCRGMDARVKIDRLRQSAKRHGGMGPKLTKRLAVFEKEFIPLRNKIVHGAITYSEDAGPLRYFLSGVANMPWAELGMGPPRTNGKPFSIPSLHLYQMGVWLSFFAKDMGLLLPLARARTTLEIENPQSHLRSEAHLQPDQQAGRAKQGTQLRTPREK